MSEVTVYLASDLHPSEHVVLQPDYESVVFDLAALREELASAKAECERHKNVRTRAVKDAAATCERLTAAEQRNAEDLRDAERYRALRKLTPYRFKKMQDASVTDGGDVLYFHADKFDALMDAELAEPTESGASDE